MQLEFESFGPGQTRALAAALARALLRPGALDAQLPAVVLLLSGDYGSGKTTFIQGLAAALGIEGAVRSPSYLIVKVYEEGRLRLVHADLYRSQSPADIEELGLDELLLDGGGAGQRGAVLAVEWPGEELALAQELPLLRLHLAVRDAETRTITLDWEPEAAELVRLLVEEWRSASAA
ncbi:tRNA (adenosine(37)-N6)-threonylcarbamoyltransferase complex ATPase subunit type 1 TsaE [bacterium]|nr:tRNA (adenosine(37)-N6)-threonylcarbamoyltransferase complex ATPase subunit type 1 TsaE [bacterium]